MPLLKPNPSQLTVLNSQKRRNLYISSRRSGKSYVAKLKALEVCADWRNWLIKRGYPEYKINPLSPPVVAIIMATRQQCKALYWQPLIDTVESNPQLKARVKAIRVNDLTIDFYNGPSLVLMGSDVEEGARNRGYKMVIAILDEIADQAYKQVQEVVLPALSDTPFSQLFGLGTPKGKGNNTLWRLVNEAKKQPDTWGLFQYTIFDSPHFSPEEIKFTINSTSPETFATEYCSTFSDFSNKIYTGFNEGNWTDSLPNKFMQVRMSIDWGQIWPALTVFGLTADNTGYYLGGWCGDGSKPVLESDFIAVCLDAVRRWKVTHIAYDPAQPASAASLAKALNEARINCKLYKAYNKQQEGMSQVNDLLHHNRIKFVHGQSSGLWRGADEMAELIQSYHRDTDKDGQVLEREAPGQFTHLLDCARYTFGVDVAQREANRRHDEYLRREVAKVPGRKPLPRTVGPAYGMNTLAGIG